MVRALLEVIQIALWFYLWVVFAWVILSWLIAFNVVNTRNPLVAGIGDFLYRITEPALGPIRRHLPNLGGIDISPMVLLLIIYLIDRIIEYSLKPMFPIPRPY